MLKLFLHSRLAVARARLENATGGGASRQALYNGFDLSDHGVFLRGELGF